MKYGLMQPWWRLPSVRCVRGMRAITDDFKHRAYNPASWGRYRTV